MNPTESVITIVVPVYKIKEEYLRKCLDSILNQSNPAWNAILVDDGSPDNSGEICDEYQSKDSRFKVIHQKNMGVSVARNAGIDTAVTEWVTFIDPDDWVESDLVDSIIPHLDTDKADILAFGYVREYENKRLFESLGDDGFVSEQKLADIRLAPLERLIINGKVVKYSINAIWNKVYRRAFLNENSLRFEPEARKGQDRIFNLYALDKTTKVYYLNKHLYHYRNDNENSIVNRYNPNTVRNSKIAFSLMESWIKKEHKSQIYTDRLNCWICSRIQGYMKLYYFNKESGLSYSEASKQLTKLLNEEPYKSAFRDVKKDMLTKEERVFVFWTKKHAYRMCLLLMKIREWVK